MILYVEMNEWMNDRVGWVGGYILQYSSMPSSDAASVGNEIKMTMKCWSLCS